MTFEHEDKLLDMEFIDKEADFSFEEIFFSTTDERGIITSGNSVFQRISGYNWDELMHKPHNIVRHPDMPKSVFYLLWDQIKQGNPVGAYVKNRIKGGGCYWVFAIVMPISDGYLSVRIKPGSDLFKKVQEIYKKALSFEKGVKNNAAYSLDLIVEEIKKAGFKNYQEFMSVALSEELLSRSIKINAPQEEVLLQFNKSIELFRKLNDEVKSISLSYEASKYVPLNLQINSAQKLEEGKAIGVISESYKSVSKEIKQQINDLSISSINFSKDIYSCQFWVCYLQVLKEMVVAYQKENSNSDRNNSNVSLIKEKLDQTAKIESKIIQTVYEMESQFSKFQVDCMRMKSIISGLAIIRIMGRVELSSISGEKDGLQELTEDLKAFQTVVAENSSNILNISQSMKIIINDITRNLIMKHYDQH